MLLLVFAASASTVTGQYGDAEIVHIKADPRDVIETAIPEWQIVDQMWFAVLAKFTSRSPRSVLARKAAAKYPLTGLAHCGVCSSRSPRTASARSAAVRIE